MTNWRFIDRTWCLWPARPKGLIEIIGGSYLSASPHISYKRLFEGLYKENLAIHAWSYLPNLDHQEQANSAWRQLRNCKKKLELRIMNTPPIIRLGHSLGCKLHLLAPDGGRNSNALIAISFNNFAAKKSIPMLNKFNRKFNQISEFNPNPEETMRLITERYVQTRNLLITFKEDSLDENSKLLYSLRQRQLDDNSTQIILSGNHLTPASFGLRKTILGKSSGDIRKQETIRTLIQTVSDLNTTVSRS
tara:strand:- start:1243 stop:1986 length:744 start_codon:yes stop_codon:yes gene_type:complete